MVATAAEATPGSLDSDAPSRSDTPSVLSQHQSFNSLTTTTTGDGEDYESIASTPKRYPAHLSRGSPPATARARNMHQQTPTPTRRPNSSQYETMEDLLTAAGYSVTRVFTPETERVQRLAHDHNHEGETRKPSAAGGKIGTLVAGWISHILPAGGSVRRHVPTPEVRVQAADDESNPFLESGPSAQRFPQAARSLRTHLSSVRAVRASSRPMLHPHHGRPDRAGPALRHTTSAPSLPRISSGGRRRALPAAWREAGKQETAYQAWSGGFAPKLVEPALEPRSSWFNTVRPSTSSTIRAHTSPPGTIRASHSRSTLGVPNYPTLHRARSAPRSSSYIHVPVPSPPVRPSPVVQPSTVVCRSQPNLGSSLSVQTRWSGADEDQPSPILTPEATSTDGLPPTPARPTIRHSRSNGFLRRKRPQLALALAEDEREPDLASIIDAFRPPSAPPSPTRRQRSIRSLRALLKDSRFPDVPVVCVASPGTVGVGGPGRAVWMSGPGWEAEVRRRNTLVRGG
ncbi:hypothetical protein FS749_009176 [Ceratobasidium sp. UAMH 11750]|nr:hypothetical protein FS749_009176 [Ceratobasidium sp. UAMH 11750]